MSTSGSYTFGVTRDQLVRNAMLCIGAVDGVEGPEPQELTDCSMFLNMMVKQWQGVQDFAPGLKMWKRKRGDLFLSNSTGQYNLGPSGDNWTNSYSSRTLSLVAVAGATSLNVSSISGALNGDFILIQLDNGSLFQTTINGAPSGSTITITTGLPSQASANNNVFNFTSKAQRPLFLVSCNLRDINNNDVPLDFMTVQDYEMLPSKVNTQSSGDPMAVYYESQLTNGVLYTDIAAAQDVTKHLHIVYVDQVQDFVSATDNPDYPQQWYMALSWGLAKQIAPMFNAVWTKEMEDNLSSALAMAQQADPEKTSYFFQPGNDGLSWMPGQYSR